MVYPVTCSRCGERVSLFDWVEHLRSAHDAPPPGLRDVKWDLP